MKTSLTAERLAALHTEGRAKTGSFVNPYTMFRLRSILRERGEDWAASVLLRDLSRRSLIDAGFPWLESGEEEILVLADDAEWQQFVKAAIR